MKRIYCGGTFDLLHPGHIEFLRSCKSGCNHVIVALNRDGFAARYKRLPIMSLEERIKMLDACRFVDEVIVNKGDEDSKPAILLVKPDLIAHGDDWTGRALMEQMRLTRTFLRKHGISLWYVPYTKGISSSEIEERVLQRRSH